MKKVAPEIEELMWALAEARDSAAIDEFGQRFPELRGELGKRLALTQSLKGASPGGRAEDIPRFRPKPAPASIWTRPAAFGFATVLLFALAFGSYFITQRVAGNSPDNVSVGTQGPAVEPLQTDPLVASPKVPPVKTYVDPGNPTLNPGLNPENLPRHLRPQTLAIKSAKFMNVITVLAEYCGLRIEMPDLPAAMADLTIEANYTDMTPMAMLSDLGTKYGFTPYSQGGNRVLLIPATQSRELSADTGGEPTP
ncbi:MAG: hypothetical protein WAO58_06220 [Fimbriimonadaceae bacterium]